MDERRRHRISSDIQMALDEILTREVSDRRLSLVRITRVKLARDGSHATVFYEVTGTEDERLETQQAMNSARGFLRSRLASHVRIRTVPVLSLVLDRSGEEGDKTLNLMRELRSD